MKKFLMMLAIAACATSAWAYSATVVTVSRWDAANGKGVINFSGHGDEILAGYYQVYGLTQEAVQRIMATDAAPTADQVANWLKGNSAADFYNRKQKWISEPNVTKTVKSEAESVSSYVGMRNTLTGDYENKRAAADANRYIVIFYSDPDGNHAFRVAKVTANGTEKANLQIDSGTASWATGTDDNGWTATSYKGPDPEPIPEPTSGLLLLLGVAGLALKRKRA